MKGYDPETFRRDGHRLIDTLAGYLERAASDPSLPVLPPATPGANEAAFPADFPDEPADDLIGFLGRALDASHHLHSPRYVGHQVTPPHPQAALVALAGALLNNGMAIYEMGPAATAMERSSLRFLASRLGWPEGADGVLTSGGSLGTLTAMLAAREARARGEPADRLCVLASEQAHYCVGRAAHVMGMGSDGLVKVATDARFRLDPGALPAALAEAERRGRRPFALVGSACSTATGAFDPLGELASFCERHGLWFHVDGAHGAAAALSPAHRGLLAGVERADSVVWDMHKMMLLPALITAVLFRDGARSYDTFSQQASYLFGDEKPWWDVGLRTIECTKRSMGMEVYAALRLQGPAALGAYVGSRFDLGKRFAALLRQQPDFELATEPDCNIVCFRHRPHADDQALDALQERARAAVVASGRYYLVKTALRGRTFLRTTLIHPHTDEGHLRGLLDAIRAASAPGLLPAGAWLLRLLLGCPGQVCERASCGVRRPHQFSHCRADPARRDIEQIRHSQEPVLDGTEIHRHGLRDRRRHPGDPGQFDRLIGDKASEVGDGLAPLGLRGMRLAGLPAGDGARVHAEVGPHLPEPEASATPCCREPLGCLGDPSLSLFLDTITSPLPHLALLVGQPR